LLELIAALADEALVYLERREWPKLYGALRELRGRADELNSLTNLWDLVKADYESGVPPRLIAKRFKHLEVTTKQIYAKAQNHGWVSPKKIQKAMSKKRSKAFYPHCTQCGNPFEAGNNKALICPTCKAFKMNESVKEAVPR
jgi:predicted Zn-ribbon and HTH transcriptional regulator